MNSVVRSLLFWVVVAPLFLKAVASAWRWFDSLALMVASLPVFALVGAAAYTLVVGGPGAWVRRKAA